MEAVVGTPKTDSNKEFPSLDFVLGNTPAPLKMLVSRVQVLSCEGADAAIPMSLVLEVDEQLGNTVYGYYLGKQVAYPVVKYHGVPIPAFTADGLSLTATKLGTPLMLDSYTSSMCTESWGRPDYARAMIKLQVDLELKESMVVAIPRVDGKDVLVGL
ncbi:hypothetical protein Tco_0931473 [Tanacetum coccineum]